MLTSIDKHYTSINGVVTTLIKIQPDSIDNILDIEKSLRKLDEELSDFRTSLRMVKKTIFALPKKK